MTLERIAELSQWFWLIGLAWRQWLVERELRQADRELAKWIVELEKRAERKR